MFTFIYTWHIFSEYVMRSFTFLFNLLYLNEFNKIEKNLGAGGGVTHS